MSEPAIDARWRALAEKVSGCSIEALRATTDDGLTIEPLYHRAADGQPQPWRRREAWSVSQRVDHPDPDIANASALLDLDGGADALTIVCAGSTFARGFGLQPDRRSFDRALDGVELDLISLRLEAGGDTLAAASVLADLIADRRMTSAGLDIDLGFDPIGQSARTGKPGQIADIHAALEVSRHAGLAGRALLADGRPYHEAGAGEAQELAAVLATAVAYLRLLEAGGLDLAAARDAIAMLLPVDADVFIGVAKMRAMRRLWARIEAGAKLDGFILRLHAETSWRMMTRFDPWVNVMRSSAAVAAAGLGGADSVTVLPMTLPLGLPDDDARRLARNTGRVLIDEAHLAKVDDPAAGSGGLEALTTGLCERAWTLFQDIERSGGIEAALRDGSLQAQIATNARRRAADFATLRRGIVGTSRFPSHVDGGIRVLDVARRPPAGAPAQALCCVRDAEPFERLRDRAEARGEVGARLSIVLAGIGAPGAFGPRASYALNYFAVAGIRSTLPETALDASNVAALVSAGGNRIVCLCGTDAAYAEQAEAAIVALREAGAGNIYMVSADDTWRKKGADMLIHDGNNALVTLETVLEDLISIG